MKNLNKNNKLHLEIQTHRKNPIGLIRSTYRDEEGKIKHQTISRITGLNIETLKLMQATLQGKTTYISDFKITSSKEYGASYTCLSILKELELDKAIYSRTGEAWVRDCIAMIIGRLIYAGSKLSLSHCNTYSSLWDVCGISDEIIDVDIHCYEAMDKLYERQGKIQEKLAERHLSDGMVMLYDITSSYMEGEYNGSDLVRYGYNRDKKRGHEQIVISLLCNADGCPIAVEVLKGNTKDETTVIDKIREIQNKYGIKNIVFVGDRGMVTKAQYNKIDHNTVKVISALTHNNIKELCGKDVIQLSLFDEKDIVEVIDGDIRYCLCKNPDMAEKETKTRRALLKKTVEELDKIVAGTRKLSNSKEIRAGKVVNKYNMGKFVIFEGSGDNLSYRLDESKIEQEQLLDGCYVIYTDVKKEDITSAEVVKCYKSLIKVEQAFRNLKTTKLEIRPIYHKTDDRIKCHVFICMLSYYIMWHMKERLKPLFENDGNGKQRKYTFEYIMECLKGIRKDKVDFCGNFTSVISKATEEQKLILDLLKVRL